MRGSTSGERSKMPDIIMHVFTMGDYAIVIDANNKLWTLVSEMKGGFPTGRFYWEPLNIIQSPSAKKAAH